MTDTPRPLGIVAYSAKLSELVAARDKRIEAAAKSAEKCTQAATREATLRDEAARQKFGSDNALADLNNHDELQSAAREELKTEYAASIAALRATLTRVRLILDVECCQAQEEYRTAELKEWDEYEAENPIPGYVPRARRVEGAVGES